MSENVNKNPMDLNGDGKVTLGEKVEYTVGKAQEKLEEAFQEIKEDAKDALGDAQELYDKAKEEISEAAADAKKKLQDLKDNKVR